MKTSDILNRARSLADLPNSNFISYEDEIAAINESWKDVYERLTQSGDDYFVREYEAIPVDNEVILPEDFYKLRSVDYMANTGWTVMEKFSLNERNTESSTDFAKYRFKNDRLVFIGKPNKVRITYYPKPRWLEAPADSIQFGKDMFFAGWELSSTFQGPFSCRFGRSESEILFLVGNVLYIQNVKTKTSLTYTVPLVVKDFKVMAGKVYFLLYDTVNDNSIIHIYNFSAGVNGPWDPLDGEMKYLSVTGKKLIVSDETDSFDADLYPLFGQSVNTGWSIPTWVRRDVVGHYYIGPNNEVFEYDIGLEITADHIAYDGTYLYVFRGSTIYRIIDGEEILLYTDINLMLPEVINGFVLCWDLITNIFYAMSVGIDVDIFYPSNLAVEILYYQMAVDYVRKQKGDITSLLEKVDKLWARFETSLIRDDYTVAKIQNKYFSRSW